MRIISQSRSSASRRGGYESKHVAAFRQESLPAFAGSIDQYPIKHELSA